MKVLFIIVSKNKNQQLTITGPERRMANVAPLWKRFGVETVVCYPPNGTLKNKFIEAGSKLIPFEIKGKFNFKAISAIRKIIRQEQINLIHTQGAAATDLLATLAAKKENIPIVITRPVMIEDQVHYTSFKRGIYEWIDKFTLKKASKIIAVSKKGFDTLKEKYKVPANKLQLVYNGINLQKFFVANRKQQLPVVGMVAHLSIFKGWFHFLNIIEQLKNRGLKFQAWIIGEGELRKKLELEVTKKNLTDVIVFKGNVSEVNFYLAAMDVFLFTSQREGLSVAVIEALAAALPVVATNVGGINEQVKHNTNGFVFNINEADKMVNAVASLLQNKMLRLEMGHASRIIATQNFSEDKMVASYVDIYKNLLKV